MSRLSGMEFPDNLDTLVLEDHVSQLAVARADPACIGALAAPIGVLVALGEVLVREDAAETCIRSLLLKLCGRAIVELTLVFLSRHAWQLREGFPQYTMASLTGVYSMVTPWRLEATSSSPPFEDLKNSN